MRPPSFEAALGAVRGALWTVATGCARSLSRTCLCSSKRLNEPCERIRSLSSSPLPLPCTVSVHGYSTDASWYATLCPNHSPDLHTRVIFRVYILWIRRGIADGQMGSAPLLDVGNSAKKRTKQYSHQKHRTADRIVTAQSECVPQSSHSCGRTGAS